MLKGNEYSTLQRVAVGRNAPKPPLEGWLPGGEEDLKQHRLKLQEDLGKVKDHFAKVQAEELEVTDRAEGQ